MNEKKENMYRLAKKKAYRGGTFIEVVSVIAIIGIFAGISWKNLSDNKKHAEVEAAASEIASLINQTRGYALTGKKINMGGNEKVPGYFTIVFSPDGLYSRIAMVSSCNDFVDYEIFENGIEISKKVNLNGYVGFFKRFCYNVPNGDGNISNIEEIIVESKSDFNIKRTVTINPYRAIVE